MTSKERVLARLHGKPVDRIPNFNILMAFAAKYAGHPMDKFCSDYRVLVESNIKSAEAFGIDIMSTMSDAYRETADFGAKIKFPHDSLPVCEHLIKTPGDIKNIKPFKIEDSTRMLDRVKAIELYKRELGDEYPIMGWIEGSAAESCDLMGLTEFIFAYYDEPELLKELMDVCLETAINCIKPQVDAGADIIGVGDAVASVIGPEIYQEFLLPYERKIFAEIKRCGAIGRLHICGNIAPLLEDLKTVGADIIDIDWMVGFAEARKALENHASVCGNFDPVTVVMDGTTQTVADAVNKCIDDGGSKCFIMAGCEIPKNTPRENLLAVHTALVSRG
ncbi:MAG: uroporphyrinogen decarboxylase family protein [Oscillospiraceae bacterium]|nr:uroporphyrinogen decarboxylase family protein [Oscillospiraceae bacterium]